MIDPHDANLHGSFREHGYLIFKKVVEGGRLAELHARILATFERARKEPNGLFNGGGLISGHLNCFPGEGAKFVYETLEQQRIIELVRTLSPQAVRLPNVGCNLNLPGSNPQNRHADGYAATPFMIVNIATVDTDSNNGAMEVLPGTHRREYKYWQLVLERPHPMRPRLERGDVLVRSSMLWHRGMPNLSATARPMLAVTWEDGGSRLDDPFRANDGQIAFFPNRYRPTAVGRLRERAFVAAPALNESLRFVRSFFGR